MSDEQIIAAADGAVVSGRSADRPANWDRDAFVQGAQDLREHGVTTPQVRSFFDDNEVVSRAEFVQAYRELGGNPDASAFFSQMLQGSIEAGS